MKKLIFALLTLCLFLSAYSPTFGVARAEQKNLHALNKPMETVASYTGLSNTVSQSRCQVLQDQLTALQHRVQTQPVGLYDARSQRGQLALVQIFSKQYWQIDRVQAELNHCLSPNTWREQRQMRSGMLFHEAKALLSVFK